jgi:hypothetical protein
VKIKAEEVIDWWLLCYWQIFAIYENEACLIPLFLKDAVAMNAASATLKFLCESLLLFTTTKIGLITFMFKGIFSRNCLDSI